jgi:N-methylhydantoinase B
LAGCYGPARSRGRCAHADGAESFAQKLAKIPDGTWSEIRYLDEALPGDRMTQRTQLNITKTGDRIRVDNVGTDAQTPGTNGIPFTSWSGSITGIVSVSMLYEQLFAYGGSERQIDYEPTQVFSLVSIIQPRSAAASCRQSQ